MTVTVTIVPDADVAKGKLADAELHFHDGPLAGMKLVGFGVWETKVGGKRNVTFPARKYTVNGEGRAFALLRPIESSEASIAVRDLIAGAYAAWELTR